MSKSTCAGPQRTEKIKITTISAATMIALLSALPAQAFGPAIFGGLARSHDAIAADKADTGSAKPCNPRLAKAEDSKQKACPAAQVAEK